MFRFDADVPVDVQTVVAEQSPSTGVFHASDEKQLFFYTLLVRGNAQNDEKRVSVVKRTVNW